MHILLIIIDLKWWRKVVYTLYLNCNTFDDNTPKYSVHPFIALFFALRFCYCSNACWLRKEQLTDTQMWDLLEQGPAVVINAVVLQDEQLADVPGSDVTGHLHRSAGVVFAVHFDYLQQMTTERGFDCFQNGILAYCKLNNTHYGLFKWMNEKITTH